MSYNPQPQGPHNAHPAAGGPIPGPQGPSAGPYAAMPHQPASPQLQAAWRYSARRKNDTAAWLLWIGGPFLVGLPVHDFYFGDIGKGLAKLGLLVLIFVSFIGGAIASAVSAAQYYSSGPSTAPDGFIIGIILAGLCFLIVAVWWIYDGVTMNKRLETTNDKIRRQIAAEHGVDPYSF
ncbi:TM2 domain-containing protein [Kocuria sp. ZOR0020]|uniref:TM2 domain-containing protein n=1 Tax=Kocuria sp. ZOR0020 TaxID=1339234 RepID=UPI000647D769|nr:TM2 domain-containing protein [Kocuria sp. ZOR0020]